MNRIAPKLLPAALLVIATICFFTLKASRPHTTKKETCGQRFCCKMKEEMPCSPKASGTEFGIFDAGSRLFTAKM